MLGPCAPETAGTSTTTGAHARTTSIRIGPKSKAVSPARRYLTQPQAISVPDRRAGARREHRARDLREVHRRLVDERGHRSARRRNGRASESRCGRSGSAAIRHQCARLVGDSAPDLVAAAHQMDARQVLPLRWRARRQRGGRNLVVPGPRRVTPARRDCRRRHGLSRPHGARRHYRHRLRRHDRHGAAATARRAARPLRGDPPVLRLGRAAAGVGQHDAVCQRPPRRPILRCRAPGSAVLLVDCADRGIGDLAVAALAPGADQL
jgi:hypothetical protein